MTGTSGGATDVAPLGVFAGRVGAVGRTVGLRTDAPLGDLVPVVVAFAAYAVLDVVTRAASGLVEIEADGPSLVVSAVVANPVPTVGLGIIVAGSVARSWTRWSAPWTALEQGRVLRWLAVGPIAVLAWEGGLYEYNFLLDRWHAVDRLLVVGLAIGALTRPLFLLPFITVSRVVAAQFAFPFSSTAAQNTDELLVLILVALAGAHLVYTLTGRAETAPTLLVVVAAIATHFYIPGRGKVLLGWVGGNDLANMAINGHTTGWLGQTDGGLASSLASIVGPLGLPIKVATVGFELGAVLAAAHHRLLRWWLPVVIVFHAINFAMLGFWFFGWIVFEVALLIVVTRPSLRPWLDQNLTMLRAGFTAIVVAVLGAILFHPPGLAWFDSPVGYGYRFDVVGDSGTRYRLPIDELGPFQQDVTFARLQVSTTHQLSGAYGVVATSAELAPLDALTSLADVAAAERPVTAADDGAAERTERFLAAYLDYANRRSTDEGVVDRVLDVVSPPSKYWTGVPGATYDHQEPVRSIEVSRSVSLTVDGEPQREQRPVELVVRSTADRDG